MHKCVGVNYCFMVGMGVFTSSASRLCSQPRDTVQPHEQGAWQTRQCMQCAVAPCINTWLLSHRYCNCCCNTLWLFCKQVRDPRVPSSANDTFLDLLEAYFARSDEEKQAEARPQLAYQVHHHRYALCTGRLLAGVRNVRGCTAFRPA